MFGKGEKGVRFVLVVPNVSISVYDISGEKKGGMKMKAPFASKE